MHDVCGKPTSRRDNIKKAEAFLLFKFSYRSPIQRCLVGALYRHMPHKLQYTVARHFCWCVFVCVCVMSIDGRFDVFQRWFNDFWIRSIKFSVNLEIYLDRSRIRWCLNSVINARVVKNPKPITICSPVTRSHTRTHTKNVKCSRPSNRIRKNHTKTN